MSTDKELSAAGRDNRPPMLVESDYESWKIRIERYIRVIEGQGVAAVQVTRDKTDEEFIEIENNRELADIQATNILSQGLPRHVFNILNQTRTRKEIWDNVELLMKAAQSSNDAMLATMNQIVNLLSGFQKQFPPTNNQLRTSSNSRSHATVHDGQIVTETVQRKALSNVAKDICSIVLASDKDRPSSEEPSSNCVRENSKVIELKAEILKQQQILAESDKRWKDDTIMKLHTQINNMSMLNVEPTVGSFDKQALETELTQLKDTITSVRIQNDGFKVENVNLKLRYQELSTPSSHSRDTLTRKITALTVKNAKLKSETLSKMHSKPIVHEKPKVLTPGMYAISSKYIVPLRRVNRAEPTHLLKKKQTTCQEPPQTFK
nr:hypothetical protein [Tanacetum cinerariifolium]